VGPMPSLPAAPPDQARGGPLDARTTRVGANLRDSAGDHTGTAVPEGQQVLVDEPTAPLVVARHAGLAPARRRTRTKGTPRAARVSAARPSTGVSPRIRPSTWPYSRISVRCARWYVRVSTAGQDPALQHDALSAADCWRTWTDVASGARAARPQLTEALASLRPGDTLCVWRLIVWAGRCRTSSTPSARSRNAGWGSGRCKNPSTPPPPVCRKQLSEIDGRLDELRAAGVGRVVAVSMEDAARSAALVERWHLARLDVAHGLTADAGREWGLYLSTAITDAEPAVFTEPGMVVLDEDGIVS